MSKERIERNKKIIIYRKKGYSLRSLGRLFRISHPRVIIILKRYKGRGAKSPKTKKVKLLKKNGKNRIKT